MLSLTILSGNRSSGHGCSGVEALKERLYVPFCPLTTTVLKSHFEHVLTWSFSGAHFPVRNMLDAVSNKSLCSVCCRW